jgi:hypothetical protein
MSGENGPENRRFVRFNGNPRGEQVHRARWSGPGDDQAASVR